MFSGNRTRCRICWKAFCCLEHRRNHELVEHCGYESPPLMFGEEKHCFRLNPSKFITPTKKKHNFEEHLQLNYSLNRNLLVKKVIVPVCNFHHVQKPHLTISPTNHNSDPALKNVVHPTIKNSPGTKYTKNVVPSPMKCSPTFKTPDFSTTPTMMPKGSLVSKGSNQKKRKVTFCDEGYNMEFFSAIETSNETILISSSEIYQTPEKIPRKPPYQGIFFTVADKLRTVFQKFPRWRREPDSEITLVSTPTRKRRKLDSSEPETSFEKPLNYLPIRGRPPLPSYYRRK